MVLLAIIWMQTTDFESPTCEYNYLGSFFPYK